MKHKYTVIAEMPIKDKLVLTLNSPRRDDDFLSKYIIVDGKKVSYQLVHNAELIIVDANASYLNKTISFC